MSKKQVKGTEKFVENAVSTGAQAILVDGEFRFGMIRKVKNTESVYVITTRKGSTEVKGRDRVTVAEAGSAVDGVWCKTHSDWKQVANAGSTYCRECVKSHMKKLHADRKAGVAPAAMTPEERKAAKEAKEQSQREQIAKEKAARLTAMYRQGMRRNAAFFLDAVKKYGETAARMDYERVGLTVDQMDQLIAGVHPNEVISV